MDDPRFSHPHGPSEPDDMRLHEHSDDEPFEQSFVPPRTRQDNGVSMQPGAAPACPKCDSSRVDARHRARRTGGAIGAIAGMASGVAFALSSAETGAAVGALAGRAGVACGAIAGAVIAGLIGGSAGCATGSVFGEVIDDKVLDNFHCHACGHTFSRSKAST